MNQILRYLKGSPSKELLFKKIEDRDIVGYSMQIGHELLKASSLQLDIALRSGGIWLMEK